MSRLPQVNGDKGNWGQILNTWLKHIAGYRGVAPARPASGSLPAGVAINGTGYDTTDQFQSENSGLNFHNDFPSNVPNGFTFIHTLHNRIYRREGNDWAILLEGVHSSNPDWSLTGNAGTNPNSNFLGTTDAQPLVIRTSNTERVRIETNGNVGIGIATPAQRLDVNGNVQFSGALMPNGNAGTSGQVLVSQGSGNAPVWQTLNQGDQDWLVAQNNQGDGGPGASNQVPTNLDQWIYTNGRVGIDTNNPLSVLHIVQTESPDLRGIVIDQYSDDRHSAQVNQRKARGTPNAPLPVLAEDILAGWWGRGYVGNNFSTGQAGMLMMAAEDWAPNSHGAGILFRTTAIGTTNPVERVRITDNGSVGIGTSTPLSRLNVHDGHLSVTNSDNTARELRLYEPSGAGTNFTAFRAQAQASDITYTLPASLAVSNTVDAGILQTDTNGNLSWLSPSALTTGLNSVFWSLTGNTGTNPNNNFLGTTDAQPLVIRTSNTERVRIDTNGNVGIGTNSPTAQFHTTGTVRLENYASGANGALLRTDSSGDLSLINFPGSTNEVLLGNATFAALPSLAWTLSGNSGTNSNNDFLGTTDNVGLTIRTNNTARMFITPTGDVGIGTTTPVSRLNVHDGHLAITNSDDTARELRLYEPSGAGTNFTAFRAQAQDSDITYILPSSLTPGNNISTGILQTDASGNLSWLNPSALLSNVGGFWSLTGNSGTNPNNNFLGTIDNQPLVFRTNNTEQVRLDTNGNFGIGTVSPTARLHVNGTIRFQGLPTTTSGNYLVVDNTGNVSIASPTQFGDQDWIVASNNEGTGGAGAAGQIPANLDQWIYTNGNVGIGTNTPGSNLEVAGQIIATGSTGFVSSRYQIVAPRGIFSMGNGLLSSIGTTSTTQWPLGISIHPSGKFLYVSNHFNAVHAYLINQSTGALTSIGTSPTGSWSRRLVIDPTGRFLYVAGESTSTVFCFTINQSTGSLAPISNVPSGNNPHGITVDPTGRFVYVANFGSNTVQMYSINQSTGALTSLGSVPTGNNPYGITVDPTGRFVYVTNSGSNTVQMYSINQSTGALTSLGSVPTGSLPRGIIVDPKGHFLYVSNWNSSTVQIYEINQSLGILTSVGTIATGTNPDGLNVDPVGRFLYVPNYGSHTIQFYSINNLSAGTACFTGNVGIGTNNPNAQLHTTGNIRFENLPTGNGNYVVIDANGNVFRHTGSPSDKRLKTNIQPITQALTKITQLRGVKYDWINQKDHLGEAITGFIAQEFEQVFPDCVAESDPVSSEDGKLVQGKVKTINLNLGFHATMVEAIKEQQRMIEQQTELIEQQQQKLQQQEQWIAGQQKIIAEQQAKLAMLEQKYSELESKLNKLG